MGVGTLPSTRYTLFAPFFSILARETHATERFCDLPPTALVNLMDLLQFL